MTWLRSTDKKKMLIDETITILKIHEQENMDVKKTSLRLFNLGKKYDVDMKKLRIGDLL